MIRALRNGAISLGLMMASASALADNVLQDVRYAAAPGGKVDITLQFAAPVGEVQAFTTDSPPRIAIDLPNTSNGLAPASRGHRQRRHLRGLGRRSRRPHPRRGRPAAARRATSPAARATLLVAHRRCRRAVAHDRQRDGADRRPDQARRQRRCSVSNIDFRRGDNGAGRIILRFDGAGAAPDMRNDGKQVVIDVSNAQIPENLRRRLDVTDFATPVVSVEPRSNAGGSRLVINTNGDYDSMAYQTGNEYVVEISPKRGSVIARRRRAPAPVRRSAVPQRYVGKPVTFNFQDVPVRTVLQLIAEESNLNIVVADTVVGQRHPAPDQRAVGPGARDPAARQGPRPAP